MAKHQAVRRVLGRRDYAKRGLLTIVGIAVVLLMFTAKSSGIIGGADEISAQLKNAGGSLRPGADVKMRGVIIGRVSDITRGSDGGVRVDLAMHDGQIPRIPANTVARILPATVFGNSFVDLVTHSAPAGDSLRVGSVVPADATQGTLELQQALDDIDRLVKALGPAELASALGSTASALDGRGAQIGAIIDRLDSYLRQLNPRMPQVRSDARKLADAVGIVRRATPDLLTAVDDGLVTARTVVAEKATIAAVITGGTALVGQGNAFLAKNENAFVSFLDQGATLLDAFYDNRHVAIVGAMQTNSTVAHKIHSVLRGGYVDTTGRVLLSPPAYYTSADRPRYTRAGTSGAGRASVSSMLDGGDRR